MAASPLRCPMHVAWMLTALFCARSGVDARSVAAIQDGPPPPSAAAIPRPPGREQSNVWLPMDVLEAKDEPARRRAMIDYIRTQIAARGSTIDMGEVDRVLAAMGRIRREDFVPEAQRRTAYLPVSVDIGEGQTLSDAYIVALMVAAARIRPGDTVLDVGTGSGYQAALLAELGAKVTSIEIVPGLAKSAGERLERLGYRRVTVVAGDGAAPLSKSPRFDAILVAAGSKSVPDAFMRELHPGGRLVLPVGPTQLAERLRLIREDEHGSPGACDLGPAAFVPLVGVASTEHLATPVDLPPCFGTPVT